MNGGHGQSDTPSQTINFKSVCGVGKIKKKGTRLAATAHKLQNKQIFL